MQKPHVRGSLRDSLGQAAASSKPTIAIQYIINKSTKTNISSTEKGATHMPNSECRSLSTAASKYENVAQETVLVIYYQNRQTIPFSSLEYCL